MVEFANAKMNTIPNIIHANIPKSFFIGNLLMQPNNTQELAVKHILIGLAYDIKKA